jgi:hypothetical protein
MISEDGPFLQAACLCEQVLEEKDGVLSAIRIVDRIVVQAQLPPGASRPETFPAITVSLWLLLSFKAGKALGNYSLQITPWTPSGLKLAGPTLPLLFEGGEDRGVNIRMQLTFAAQEQGIYWFDVVLGDRLVTRMPLRILIQTFGTTSPPQL